MNSAIIDLIYRTGGKDEDVRSSEQYKILQNRLCRVIEDLQRRLDSNGKKMLNELEDVTMGMESEACITYFREGVKTGARLMQEILENN